MKKKEAPLSAFLQSIKEGARGLMKKNRQKKSEEKHLPFFQTKKGKKLLRFTRKTAGRFLIIALMLGFGILLMLWDLGVFDLPFLIRSEKKQPADLPATGEEVIVFDYDAYRKDILAALTPFEKVENAADLITPNAFNENEQTLIILSLKDTAKKNGESLKFAAQMGYFLENTGTTVKIRLPFSAKDVCTSRKYHLTQFFDSEKRALFQKIDTAEFFYYDKESAAFLPSDFDPVLDIKSSLFNVSAYFAPQEGTLFRYTDGENWGYRGEVRDSRGRLRKLDSGAVYKTAYAFYEGFALAVDQEDCVVILNTNFENAFPALRFALPEKVGDEARGFYYFENGLMRVILKSTDENGLETLREAVINTKGEEFSIPHGFSVVSYSDGIFLLSDKKSYGFMNHLGKWIAEPQYSAALSFSEGLAVVTNSDGKKGVIDKTGKEVIGCAFDEISPASGGVFMLFDNQAGWFLCAKVEGVFREKTDVPTSSERPYYTKRVITKGSAGTVSDEEDENGNINFAFPDDPLATTRPVVPEVIPPAPTTAAPTRSTTTTTTAPPTAAPPTTTTPPATTE